jgi:hypothetical protein
MSSLSARFKTAMMAASAGFAVFHHTPMTDLFGANKKHQFNSLHCKTTFNQSSIAQTLSI